MESVENNALMEICKKQAADEVEQDKDAKLEIERHRKNGQGLEILVHKEDGSKTWGPLRMIGQSEPVSFERYAQNHELLDPGWKRLQPYDRNQMKIYRMMKQAKPNPRGASLKFKYVVEVP